MSSVTDPSQLDEIVSKMRNSKRHLKIGMKRYYNHSRDSDIQKQRRLKAAHEKAICDAQAELSKARKIMYQAEDEDYEDAAKAASIAAINCKERLATGNFLSQ